MLELTQKNPPNFYGTIHSRSLCQRIPNGGDSPVARNPRNSMVEDFGKRESAAEGDRRIERFSHGRSVAHNRARIVVSSTVTFLPALPLTELTLFVEQLPHLSAAELRERLIDG
jgi:hypothetical protein